MRYPTCWRASLLQLAKACQIPVLREFPHLTGSGWLRPRFPLPMHDAGSLPPPPAG